jgi:hypothetical protein
MKKNILRGAVIVEGNLTKILKVLYIAIIKNALLNIFVTHVMKGLLNFNIVRIAETDCLIGDRRAIINILLSFI